MQAPFLQPGDWSFLVRTTECDAPEKPKHHRLVLTAGFHRSSSKTVHRKLYTFSKEKSSSSWSPPKSFGVHSIFLDSHSSDAYRYSPPIDKLCGFLDDGKTFIVYHSQQFVYGVDVAKSKIQNESLTGIYIMPMSLPNHLRHCPSSIRTVCLSPRSRKSLPLSSRIPFRAFVCNIVAPDHCIVGNMKNVLSVLFMSISSPIECGILNVLIENACKHNGLPYRPRIWKCDKKSLASVPFSVIYAAFHVFPHALMCLSRIYS